MNKQRDRQTNKGERGGGNREMETEIGRQRGGEG